jgi:sensor domain CHASE-containing protein
MNKIVTYVILAAAVIVSGAVAYFIVQKHKQLIDED